VISLRLVFQLEQVPCLPSGQYKISKIKLSINMTAVTPATESTNASLASW